MMKLIAFILFLFVAGAPYCLEAQGLTLEECFEIAVDKNPEEKAAQAGICIAGEEVGMAGAPYYPDVKFHTGYNRFQTRIYLPNNFFLNEIPPIVGPVNDWSINVSASYVLFDAGAARARLCEALAQWGIASAEAEQIRQKILLNVALAYHQVAATKELVSVAEEIYDRFQDHLELAKDRFQVGNVPLIDVRRTETELSNSKQQLVKSQSNYKIALGYLNTAMGLSAMTETIIFPKAGVSSCIKGNAKNLVGVGLNHRPEVKRAQHQITRSEGVISEAKSAFYPEVSIESLYGRRDEDFFPKDKEWLVGVAVNFSIFDGFKDTHKLRRARWQKGRMCAEQQRVALQVEQEIWEAYNRHDDSYERIQTTVAQITEAEESLRLAKERYEVGANTINDLLDAEAALSRAQGAHIQASWEYKSAESELFWAQGIIGKKKL